MSSEIGSDGVELACNCISLMTTGRVAFSFVVNKKILRPGTKFHSICIFLFNFCVLQEILRQAAVGKSCNKKALTDISWGVLCPTNTQWTRINHDVKSWKIEKNCWAERDVQYYLNLRRDAFATISETASCLDWLGTEATWFECDAINIGLSLWMKCETQHHKCIKSWRTFLRQN